MGAVSQCDAQYEPCVHNVAALMPVLAQNAPMSHGVGAALAAGLYVPFGDACCVDEFDPVGQKYPALQLPVGALSPDDEQYMPAVHGMNADMPVVLQKLPIGLSVKFACSGAGQ